MLYMLCPTCGELLADKQKHYEKRLFEIYQKHDMQKNPSEEAFDKARSDIINVDFAELRYCCRMRILTYVKLVDLII